MDVGILSFHGDVAEHLDVLRSLGADSMEVKTLHDLRDVSHLIIPGGESTVMHLFLEKSGVGEKIRERVHDGDLAVYGTCAGAILLAKEVTGKHPPLPLGLIDIVIERNSYGTQAQSFEMPIDVKGIGSVQVSFIRAPRILHTGPEVEVLAKHGGDPVLVMEGRVLAGTFHPEVRGENRIHKLFLDM